MRKPQAQNRRLDDERAALTAKRQFFLDRIYKINRMDRILPVQTTCA
jgi:hypothetical protein